MSSERPFWYCGANIVRFQSGSKNVGRTSTAAASASARGAAPTGAVRRRWLLSRARFTGPPGSLRLHDEVSLHLLVERGAEVRAVVGEDPRLVGLEGDRLRLA